MLKATGISIVCFLLFLLIHSMTFHFAKNLKARTRSILITFICMIPCYYVIYMITPPDPLVATLIQPSGMASLSGQRMELVHFFMGLLFYAFLFLGYLEFYFTADRSMTCRMLTLLVESRDKKMSEKDFVEQYDTDWIIRRRLDDLTWGGYLVKEDNHYVSTTKGEIVQKLYSGVIRFLNLSKF